MGNNIRFIALTICTVAFLTDARANDHEGQLIQVLQSDAPPPAKDDACEKLKSTGTVKSVPALAALLTDRTLSHSARYALEAIDSPDAAAALRDALPKTTGLTKAGIIDSLGQRRDRQSVDALKELARDPDEHVAAAAVAALGRIGGPESLGALRAARSSGPKSLAPLALDAMLACADGILAGGFRSDAARAYREVYNADDATEAHRTAAYRGLILADADDHSLLIQKALTGTDRSAILAALRLVAELDFPPTSLTLIALLPKVSPEIRPALIDGIALRGDTSAVPEIEAYAKDDKQPRAVRIAALRALGVLNGSISVLAGAAAGDDAELRDVARYALLTMKREGTPGQIIHLIKTASPLSSAYRVELIRALGHRYERDAAAFLLNLTENRDDAVSAAAFQSLAMVGHDWHVQPLVRMIARATSDERRAAAERTLRAIVSRAVHLDQTTRAITVGLAVADPAAAAALIRVCAAIDAPAALAALREGTRSPDPAVADAAVRAIASSTNPAAARDLLSIAKGSKDESQQVLALRGVVRLADEAPGMTPQARAALLKEALRAAGRVEEKRLVLSALGRTPVAEALAVVEPLLGDSAVAEEAALACLQIAKALIATHPDEARAACDKLLATGPGEKLAAEAKALRERIGER